MIVVKAKIHSLKHRLLNTINLTCSLHPGVLLVDEKLKLVLTTLAAPEVALLVCLEDISMLMLALSSKLS